VKELVGKTIKEIYLNENFVKFVTDNGYATYEAYGDCCSQCVFYDFIGVKDLIGSKVVSVKDLNLGQLDYCDEGYKSDVKQYQEFIEIYGVEIVYLDEKFGERTAVISFRNYSNGFYGGLYEKSTVEDVLPRIYDDVITTENLN